MTKPLGYRELCEKHFKNGKSTDEIYKIMAQQVTKRTIRNWRSVYNEHGRIVLNKPPGRRRIASNLLKVNKVKKYAKCLSMNAIAKKIEISPRTVGRIVKENGKYFRYLNQFLS
jgi:transposase